jgi:hypothetical protein
MKKILLATLLLSTNAFALDATNAESVKGHYLSKSNEQLYSFIIEAQKVQNFNCKITPYAFGYLQYVLTLANGTKTNYLAKKAEYSLPYSTFSLADVSKVSVSELRLRKSNETFTRLMFDVRDKISQGICKFQNTSQAIPISYASLKNISKDDLKLYASAAGGSIEYCSIAQYNANNWDHATCSFKPKIRYFRFNDKICKSALRAINSKQAKNLISSALATGAESAGGSVVAAAPSLNLPNITVLSQAQLFDAQFMTKKITKASISSLQAEAELLELDATPNPVAFLSHEAHAFISNWNGVSAVPVHLVNELKEAGPITKRALNLSFETAGVANLNQFQNNISALVGQLQPAMTATQVNQIALPSIAQIQTHINYNVLSQISIPRFRLCNLSASFSPVTFSTVQLANPETGVVTAQSLPTVYSQPTYTNTSIINVSVQAQNVSAH